jgi:hypothetical protein
MTEHNDINTTILLRDNSPVDDFLGLTPTEIHHLLYNTFGEKSLIQFSKVIDDKTLDQIPLFRIAEEYLRIVQRDKQIKLTPLGALPKKVMVELYDKRFLLDEYIETGITKLWKEEDCVSISSVRITLELAGLVKKLKGKLSLTKNGTKFIQSENRLQFFKHFFQAFTDKFFWGFNDNYTEQPLGQLGWGYTAFMLNKFGDQERKVDFYAAKFLTAFPIVITFFSQDITSPKSQFYSCYSLRSFERFFLWLGFVTIDKQKMLLDFDTDKLKRSEVFNRVFAFDET